MDSAGMCTHQGKEWFVRIEKIVQEPTVKPMTMPGSAGQL